VSRQILGRYGLVVSKAICKDGVLRAWICARETVMVRMTSRLRGLASPRVARRFGFSRRRRPQPQPQPRVGVSPSRASEPVSQRQPIVCVCFPAHGLVSSGHDPLGLVRLSLPRSGMRPNPQRTHRPGKNSTPIFFFS
jgi:hypothetical protein